MKTNQKGTVNAVTICLVTSVVLLIAVLIFAVWAFSGRQKYKNQTDQIVATAVNQATAKTQASDAAQFAQAAKNPLKTYQAPSQYNSVSVQYPKTWSAYVSVTSSSDTPVNGYFQPDVVPSVNDQSQSFALRLQVLQQAYSQVVSQYSGLATAGQVTVTPYSPPLQPKVVGVEVSGSILTNKQGTMIIVPVRNTTVELWTESPQFLSDFNQIILPHFNFSP